MMRFSHCSLICLALTVLGAVSLAVAADYPAPVQRAIERLAQVSDVGAAAIEVVSHELVEWPDMSLGAPRPGQVYAQVVTAGYRVILAVEGRRYEYHTDLKGRVVLAASGPSAADEAAAPTAPVPGSPAARCCADLARRLHVTPDTISVQDSSPATFLDGALGFPRPGEVYTKAITSGQRLTLLYRGRLYLYAANDTVVRYGGPAAARQFSALYLEPIANEPNMNGNLVQVALAGDSPRTLVAGVDNFRPQPDGSVIAMRRTSRSGYDLLHLAPGQTGEGVRLASGLYFGDAAVTADGMRWAALVRPGLGSGWQFISGPVAQEAAGNPIMLPEGRPQRVYLHMTHPVVRLLQGENLAHYELVDGAFQPVRFEPPATEETLMSKSTSLAVDTKEVDGQPVTEIATAWWNGQRDPIATIAGFAVKEYALTPGGPFLLLSGRRGEQDQGYTVDLVTGEVLLTVAETRGPVRLLLLNSGTPY